MAHAVTLRLEDEDFERLEAEAQRLGIRPGTLARSIVSAAVANDHRTSPRHALARLRSRARRLPPIDPVEVVRQGRRELEERSFRQ